MECRSGGATGEYQLIFSFANPLVNVGNASVTSGAGSVSDQMIDADPHNYIVNLTGVSNAQVIRVSLTNVNDSAGHSSSSVLISMGVLLGDTSGNGAVNASDIVADESKFRSGGGRFQLPLRVSLSGTINANDIAQVKSMSGTALPSGSETTVLSKGGRPLPVR